jgi:hypothetical protein
MEADLGQAEALSAGERSISLKIAIRLDVELVRAALRGEDRGVDVNCWWSGGTMVRFEGRFRSAFWVFLQQVSEYTTSTLKHTAASLRMLQPAAVISPLCAATSMRIASSSSTIRHECRHTCVSTPLLLLGSFPLVSMGDMGNSPPVR